MSQPDRSAALRARGPDAGADEPLPLGARLTRARRAIVGLRRLGLLLAALFGGLVFSCAYLGTAGPARTATDFLTLTATRGPAASYAAAAPAFRAAISPGDWSLRVRETGLDRFKSASWSSRRVDGKVGQVRGQVRTRDGRRRLAQIGLVHDRSGWTVTSVELPEGRKAAPSRSGNGMSW